MTAIPMQQVFYKSGTSLSSDPREAYNMGLAGPQYVKPDATLQMIALTYNKVDALQEQLSQLNRFA